VAGLEVLNDRPPVEAALAYIARGWPVFPVAWVTSPDGPCACRSGASCTHPAKHPLVPGGTSSATTDRSHVLDWWRHWPAAGIGLVTGARSGLAVLDVDPRHGGSGSLDALRASVGVPATLTAQTGGGGQHLYFAIGDAQRVPNTAGRLPALGEAAGLDIRGEGGYVVAPPSSHLSGNRYLWLAGTAGPAPLPAWLQRPSRPPRPARQVSLPAGSASERYVAAVLRREADAVASAAEGQRSDQLNRSAFALGTLVGGGALTLDAVTTALLDAALDAGLGYTEASRTIASGLRAGMARPRSVI